MISKKRVGYLGGTFDPPHLGHEILAGEAFYQLQLDEVRWLITPDPPHKINRELTPIRTRLEMVQLVMNRQNDFSISDVDLQRAPPHYAADTVQIIKDQYPDSELIYIIGEDSLCDLPEWHDPQRFLSFIDQLAVAHRPGYEADLGSIERKLPGISDKLIYLTEIMVEISSSQIRDRVQNGGDYQHFLAEDVAGFIKANHLYQS